MVDPANSVARSLIVYHDLTLITILALGVGIRFFLVSFYGCRFWSRGKNKDEKVEFWWAMLPLLWLLVLAYPSLVNLFKIDASGKCVCMFLGVIGHQWYWEYRYSLVSSLLEWEEGIRKSVKYSNPILYWWGNILGFSRSLSFVRRWFRERFEFMYDSFIVSTEDLRLGEYRLFEVDWRVVLPTKKRILLGVSRVDVIHRWSIPSLGIKLDGVPGKHNLLQFVPRRLGIYYGQCSELCGVNHSYIPIVVEVIKWEDFVNWSRLTRKFYNGVLSSVGRRVINKLYWEE